MLESNRQSRSPVPLSARSDSTRPDTANGARNSVPASIGINLDLGIDPVAYQYESWFETADGWVESFRSSVETMPDPDHERIRGVTPLVPLSDVEALVERMVLSGEGAMLHERPDATGDTSPP